MAGFARLLRYCWIERGGRDMMLFVVEQSSSLYVPRAFVGDIP